MLVVFVIKTTGENHKLNKISSLGGIKSSKSIPYPVIIMAANIPSQDLKPLEAPEYIFLCHWLSEWIFYIKECNRGIIFTL